jgi:hypothetical protein
MLDGVEPIFYPTKLAERRFVFFKKFKIKGRLNLRQHTELLRQFFEALIKNSPRLRGAPQVVQRLLDWPNISFTERNAFILYTVELHLSHTTLTIICTDNSFIG